MILLEKERRLRLFAFLPVGESVARIMMIVVEIFPADLANLLLSLWSHIVELTLTFYYLSQGSKMRSLSLMPGFTF